MSIGSFTGISEGAEELNIELPPGTEAAFEAYYDFLENHGRQVNLTAISGSEEVVSLHFLDSLALLNILNFKNKKVIDIGSGAGFPGVPLKLAEPSIDLTLLDSAGKRISFLSELSKLLDIEATCVYERAEEAAHKQHLREHFNIVVSRAVARLNMLCELCLPYVAIGGYFIAMKTTDSEDETAEAENAVSTLGCELTQNFDYKIPGKDIIRRAVVIKKITGTPEKYPRRFAKIQKSPL